VGEDAIKAGRSILIYCPVAPLMHDGDMLRCLHRTGRWDLPVMVMPMPVTGRPAG